MENQHARDHPFLWFDNHAEEAVNFYVSIFKGAQILNTARYGEAGPGPAEFTEALSFVVKCDAQQEIDDDEA